MKPTIRISVRNLVEFLLRSGDIDNRSASVSEKEAMLLGAKIHRKIQKAQGKDYRAEVVLKSEREYDDLILKVEGRADGIVEGEIPLIDEIKGVFLDPETMTEPVEVHKAQARCYAAIYLAGTDADQATVRLTYVHLKSEEVRTFEETCRREELLEFFDGLLADYLRWARWSVAHRIKRNASCDALAFPFPYREGQRKLIGAVYHALHHEKELFIEAPTGVGKTLSVVFPSVKAVGEEEAERIFYLTAKTITRTVGEEAFSILRSGGLCFHVITLTAKEKLCPLCEMSCNPEDCPYARGHFDRVNDAVFDLLQTGLFFDRETILSYAKERTVCPFEFSLDLALWCDAVICDYNYAFDPKVKLKRFFGETAKSDAILLIDEAHNLVDRAREMYSASLIKEHVLAAKKLVKDRDRQLVKCLEAVNRRLLAEKKKTQGLRRLEDVSVFTSPLMKLAEQLAVFFEECKDPDVTKELREFSFEVYDFLSAFERMTDHYVAFAEESEDGFCIRIFCVDPSADLSLCKEKANAVLYFSATLLPIGYYQKLLTDLPDSPAIYAPSPFDPKRRCVLIARDVTTRYKARGEKMYDTIARYIHDTSRAKVGNYIVFFPSYRMMEEVLALYRERYDEPVLNWVAQSRYMREEDRELFLENFYEDPKRSLIAFCVMGGIFGEGIDLIGSRLIGAIIVGTGLPQITQRNDLLRSIADERQEDGFAYAYRIPGMNRVLQAAGRVIRTETDRGVIVLLDDRFLTQEYRQMMPVEWSNLHICEVTQAAGIMKAFWDDEAVV